MDLPIEATISVSIDDPFIGDSLIDERGEYEGEVQSLARGGLAWRLPRGTDHPENPTTPLSSSAARGEESASSNPGMA